MNSRGCGPPGAGEPPSPPAAAAPATPPRPPMDPAAPLEAPLPVAAADPAAPPLPAAPPEPVPSSPGNPPTHVACDRIAAATSIPAIARRSMMTDEHRNTVGRHCTGDGGAKPGAPPVDAAGPVASFAPWQAAGDDDSCNGVWPAPPPH